MCFLSQDDWIGLQQKPGLNILHLRWILDTVFLTLSKTDFNIEHHLVLLWKQLQFKCIYTKDIWSATLTALMYIYEKNFIPYVLVLGSNAHLRYKMNHRYENSMGIRNGL